MVLLVNQEHPHITIVSLNRPEKRNALNSELLESLIQLIDSMKADPKQRVLILKGEGNVFCAGLDLTASSSKTPEILAETLKNLYTAPFVTIALLHGAAIGGGAGIMSACDFVFADAETKIGYPESRLGLVPAQVMAFLMRQLRQRDLRELVLLSELIDANRAQEMGLINRVIPKDKLITEALRWSEIILKNAPLATAETKNLIDVYYPMTIEEDLYKGLATLKQILETDEAKEGIKAFFEKRDPIW